MFIQASIVSHKHLTSDQIEFLEECDPNDFVDILDGNDSEVREIVTSETFETLEFWSPDYDGQIVVFDDEHPDADRLRNMGEGGKGYWGDESYVRIQWDYSISESQAEWDKLTR